MAGCGTAPQPPPPIVNQPVAEEHSVLSVTPISTAESFAELKKVTATDPYLTTEQKEAAKAEFASRAFAIALPAEATGVVPDPDSGTYALVISDTDPYNRYSGPGDGHKTVITNGGGHQQSYVTSDHGIPSNGFRWNSGMSIGIGVKDPSPELLQEFKSGRVRAVIFVRPDMLLSDYSRPVYLEPEMEVFGLRFQGIALTSDDYKTVFAHVGTIQ